MSYISYYIKAFVLFMNELTVFLYMFTISEVMKGDTTKWKRYEKTLKFWLKDCVKKFLSEKGKIKN